MTCSCGARKPRADARVDFLGDGPFLKLGPAVLAHPWFAKKPRIQQCFKARVDCLGFQQVEDTSGFKWGPQ